MTTLTIRLFGGLIIEQDGDPIPKLISRKADVLLAYLAQEPRTHSREVLATLLWDDRTQKQAMSNLRTIITSLRKHVEPFVTITRKTLEIQPDVVVDTAVFQQQLAAAEEQWPSPTAVSQIEEALTLYVGDFLDGVLVSDSIELEEWIQFTREQLRQGAIDARQDLVTYYLNQGEYSTGIRHAAILLEMDPWNEEIHRQMMQLLARSGQRQAALGQYETCVRLLDEELGIPPEPETTELYEKIQTAVTTTSNLPAIATTFVGRERELSLCLTRLNDPECRLLTIIGLGGMGKTRLGLQVATALQAKFLNGVFFVSLAAITSSEGIVTTVAEALPVAFQDKASTEIQLLNYLRNKEILLFFDNFEHLLAGAGLLSKILRQAPHVKLLVTSRIRLDLKPEWLLELDGLPYPEAETAVSQPEQYAAIHLFEQRAQVIALDFSLSDENLPSVKRICQIVHGIPLGIELAAAWIRFLPITELLQQIEQNLDMLATTMRDVPERQRSLTAVFDYVWTLLKEDEQRVFAQLSIFRGSFDVKSFWTITTGSPWTLAALVEKSLLHKGENGRYRLIEALRLYTTTKLADLPDIQTETQAQHSHYYADLLHQQESQLNSRTTRSALNVIQQNLDNIHAAWDYAVAAHRWADLALAQNGLVLFHIYRGPYQEGAALLETAVSQLAPHTQDDPDNIRILAQLHNACARMTHFTANFDDGIESAQTGIELGKQIGDLNIQAMGYFNLGTLSERKSEYEAGVDYLQQAIALAQEVGNAIIEANAYRFWGTCLHRQSHFDEASERFQTSLKIARRIQNQRIIADCLRGLGNVNRILGDFDQAREYHEEAITIARDIDDQVALSASLINLGNISASTGNLPLAAQYHTQSMHFYQNIGNRYMEAICLVNIGGIAQNLNQFEKARQDFQKARQFARDVNNRWVENISLLNLNETFNYLGRYEQAYECGYQALQFFEEIDESMARNHILMTLGETLVHLNRTEEAIAMLQEAVALRRQFKNKPLVLEAVAALGHGYLAQNNPAQALTAVEEILQFLQDGNTLEGIAIFRVYGYCYKVLVANDDPRQQEIAKAAYDELQTRTAGIEDSTERQTFLQSTAWHRQLIGMFGE